MHALVTGGGGFLGRYIVEQLSSRGDHVRIFSRNDYPELAASGVEVYRGDLQDMAAVSAACAGIDCVFHSAGKVGIWGTWSEFFRANVLGTHNVLDACAEQGVGRLVFTSSPSVTFDGRDQCGVDESAPYPKKWRAHYPHTKAIAEQEVLSANDANIRTCALRPHLIWGPRDHHLTARLIQRARSGQLRRVGDGVNRIDITYVENAAQAHLQAADSLAIETSPVAGNAYFLSQGEPVNCWQWIDDILALVNLPPVERRISLPRAWSAGALLEAAYWTLRIPREPPMTRYLPLQLAKSHWFDISAARRDFGYQPRISTAEGMRLLGMWLNDHSVVP